MHIKAKNEYN